VGRWCGVGHSGLDYVRGYDNEGSAFKKLHRQFHPRLEECECRSQDCAWDCNLLKGAGIHESTGFAVVKQKLHYVPLNFQVFQPLL
jgi:hypothetical protein